jgi:hypothetical protein
VQIAPDNRSPTTDNYFFPFFFAGVFAAGFFAGVLEALAIPSASDRLSSTMTVWVIGSVPLVSGAGLAVAGAMVCVVGCEAAGLVFCREHAAGKSAANIRRRMAFFTRNPNWDPMQFP